MGREVSNLFVKREICLHEDIVLISNKVEDIKEMNVPNISWGDLVPFPA